MSNVQHDKSLIILVIGIVAAIISGVLVVKGHDYYNQMVPIVYASQEDIQPYTPIKEEDLIIMEVPKITKMDETMYQRKEDVIGKVSKSLIPANTPISRNQILNLSKSGNMISASLTQLKDPNLVAYTIATNQVDAVGGKISPNDMVHIIATMQVSTIPNAPKKTVSKIIVPYAKVLDIVGTGSKIQGVTFALTPQQVLDVAFSQKNGTISFAILPFQYNMDSGNYITTEENFRSRQFGDKVE